MNELMVQSVVMISIAVAGIRLTRFSVSRWNVGTCVHQSVCFSAKTNLMVKLKCFSFTPVSGSACYKQ